MVQMLKSTKDFDICGSLNPGTVRVSTANSKAAVILSRCAIFRPATAEFRIIVFVKLIDRVVRKVPASPSVATAYMLTSAANFLVLLALAIPGIKILRSLVIGFLIPYEGGVGSIAYLQVISRCQVISVAPSEETGDAGNPYIFAVTTEWPGTSGYDPPQD